MAHILFIEDDPDVVISYRLLFEARGHTITGCRTGEEALEVAAKERADIVVCDMALPGMDGAAVCRRLKDDKMTRDVPVILFTCVRVKYGIDISMDDKDWIPADLIIDKGGRPDVLLKAIEEMLSSRGKG